MTTPSSSSINWPLVGVVSAIGAGLWYLLGPPLPHLGRKRNPLSTPTTRGKVVAYRVDLEQDTIRMLPDGTAMLVRSQQTLAQFAPLPHQKTKIRSGSGEILIFTDQLVG